MILTLLPGLVLLAALTWRFWPGPFGFLASGLVLLATLRVAVLRVPAAWLLFTCASLGAAISLAGALEFLWPCELTCAGGEAWQQWRGVPLTLGGTAALAVLALSSLWDVRRRRLGVITQVLGWANVGASCYFLGLAAWLRMACGHCLSVHTAVLSLLAVLATSRLRLAGGLPVAVVVAAVIHAGYAPVRAGLGDEEPPVTPGDGGGDGAGGGVANELSAEAQAFLERADAGRTVGPDQAPFRLEIVQAFTCGHCARYHNPILSTLQELCDKGELQLIWRHQVPWNQPEGPQLLELAMVAAAEDSYEDFAQDAFAAQKGNAPDVSWRDGPTLRLLKSLAGRRDLEPGEQVRQQFPEALRRLVAAERSRLRELGATGELPHAFLYDGVTGELLQQWGGDDFEPYQVRQYLLVAIASR